MDIPVEVQALLPDEKPYWHDSVTLLQAGFVSIHNKYRQFKRGDIDPNVEVFEYSSPEGPGYVMYEYKTVDNAEYVRSTNTGPETWRAHDWQIITNTL